MTTDLPARDVNKTQSLSLQNQSLLREWHKQANVHLSYLAPSTGLAQW